MIKKEYYTFADLTMRLRDDYKEIRRILKKMEKCILIQSPYKTKFELNFLMRDPRLSIDDKPKIALTVTKENAPFSEKVNKAITNITKGRYNPIAPLIDSATFYYTIDGGTNIFEFENKFKFQHAFWPTVVLTDESYIRFRELCDQLKQNRLYSMPVTGIELNSYQNFFISGKEVSLFDGSGQSKWINVEYNVKRDKALIESNTSYNGFKVEELFMTQIPKYLLSSKWTSLLDSIPESVCDVCVDDVKGRKKEEFGLKIEDNGLSLIKKNR